MSQPVDRRKELPPDKAAEYLLEECRMILPGLQGLFGFQLIAVFNEHFGQVLTRGEQIAHLSAIALVVIAIAFIMAPAALHRQSNPFALSDAFIRVSTRLVLASMPPLIVAIAIDVYLVARAILSTAMAPAVLAGCLAGFTALAWFALPRLVRV